MKFSIKSNVGLISSIIKNRNQQGDISDFIVSTFGIIFSSFFSYLVTREINLILTEKEFGEFSYSYSLFQLVFVIISLGLYHSYLRFNSNGVVLPLVKFIQFFTLIGIIIFSLIIYFFTKNIYTCFFSFILVYYERTYFYRSLKLLKHLNFILITTSLLNFIILKIYANSVNHYYSNHIIQIYGFCYFISIAFFLIRPSNIQTKSDFNKIDVLKYSLPLIGVTIVEWLLNFCNQIIIKQFLGFQELAAYSMAFRALFIFRFISSLFLMFYPTIYFRDIPQKKMGNIIFFRKTIILILFICILIMCCFPNFVYSIMGGTKYIQTTYLFIILLIGDFLRIISSFYGLFFTYKIKTYLNLGIQFIASLINIGICILLIGHFGIISAAISNCAACIFIFGSTLIIAKKMESSYVKI